MRTPVAPISGFKRMGGTTRAVSSTTSPISPGNVVVVEDVVLVSGEVSVDSEPPPHAEAKRKRIVKIIKGFFFFIKIAPLIYNFIQKKT